MAKLGGVDDAFKSRASAVFEQLDALTPKAESRTEGDKVVDNDSHKDAQAMPPPGKPPRERAQASRKVCYKFSQTGHCRFGDSCRFTHVEAPSQRDPSK